MNACSGKFGNKLDNTEKIFESNFLSVSAGEPYHLSTVNSLFQ